MYSRVQSIMATAFATPTRHRSYKLYPHAQWYFFAAIATTWIGFSRSYFMRLGQVTIYHHIHGAIAGLWIATLIVQPILYQRGLLRLHRRLGYVAAYGLAPLMMIGGAVMLHLMLAPNANYPPGAAYTLGFLDFLTLLEFPIFVFLAVYYARNLALHARWIAGTVLLLLPPALTRVMFFLPFVRSFGMALNLCYVIVEALLVLLILDDRKYGRIRAPYPLMMVLVAIAHGSVNFTSHFTWWTRLADWYGRL